MSDEAEPLLGNTGSPRGNRCLCACIAITLLAILAAVVFIQSGNAHGKPAVAPAPPPAPVPDFLQTVVPGVHLSPSSIFTNFSVLNSTMGGEMFFAPSQMALGRWVLGTIANLTQYVGQPKTDVLDTFNNKWHQNLRGNTPLPAGYQPFGSPALMHFSDETEAELNDTLALFLKTNAFYSSALSLCAGHPCLRRTGNGWFAKILASVNHSVYHLVDADFDNNFGLKTYQVYITQNGEETQIKNATRLQTLTYIATLLNYYSECLHTAIHTFQYVGGSALIDASTNSAHMRAFARTFAINVFKTYNDVVGLDLHAPTPGKPDGVLVGGLFVANRDGILNTLSQVIGTWGSFSTAQDWVDKFALAGFDKATSTRLGMLRAFQDQVALLGPYTHDVVRYMEQNEDYQLQDVQHRLKTFFANAGKQQDGTLTFALPDLTSWLHLQAVTGIFHGQTLSFTRFMATRAALVAISPSDVFTPFDAGYYRATSPTIVGAIKDRYVMGDAPLRIDGVTDQGLLDIIAGYTRRTNDLKAAELARWDAAGLVEKQGWIVSDFFPEGWDGRQLTINSYL